MRALTIFIIAISLSLFDLRVAQADAAAPETAAGAEAAPATPKAAPPEQSSKTTAQVIPSVRPEGPPTSSDEEFLRRVRTMEEQVTSLKEQVFRTRSRLFLLQESILGGASIGQGAKARLIHRNEMGGSFVLESAAYSLDGAPIFSKIDLGNGDLEAEEIPLFNGRIQPGQHQIVVQLRFRGHGYGVFKYLDDYKFTVESSYTFDAEAGRMTNLKIIAFEQGNFATDIKDRPAIRYELNLADDEAPNAIPGQDLPGTAIPKSSDGAQAK